MNTGLSHHAATLLAEPPKLVEPVASTPHLMLAFLAGIAVIMLTMLAYSTMISKQENRNARLTDEINELQRSIEEIDGLERQKERLLARMEIIDQLQKSRPELKAAYGF